MFVSGKAIFVLGFIGFMNSLCASQEIQNQNLLYDRKLEAEQREAVLQCYDCNSEYDPRCADPFNSYTIGVINCTDRKTPEHLLDPFHPEMEVKPTVCRKIVQIVERKTRVIRSCGYLRDDHDDQKCFRRTGTANVEVYHCSCTKSLCNGGYPIRSYLSVTLLLTAAAVLSSGLSF